MALFLPFAITGCTKKPKVKSCTVDADCRFDASGKEINGLCQNGFCQECTRDTDCKDLKQCIMGRCIRACQSDSDCSANNYCKDNFCMENCTRDDQCQNGEVCLQGRCSLVNAELDSQDVSVSIDCKDIGLVHFDFDSSEVKGEGKDEVLKVGHCLQADPSLIVTIEGHADDRGTIGYNQTLGQERADAVKAFLIASSGIAPNRVNTISYGHQKPLDPARTEDAWRKNRRAQFILQKP